MHRVRQLLLNDIEDDCLINSDDNDDNNDGDLNVRYHRTNAVDRAI